MNSKNLFHSISSKCFHFHFCKFLSALVCLKFNIPEGRQQDLKVYDQSDTEVDVDVFEEIVNQSPGTFRVMLSNKEDAGNN